MHDAVAAILQNEGLLFSLFCHLDLHHIVLPWDERAPGVWVRRDLALDPQALVQAAPDLIEPVYAEYMKPCFGQTRTYTEDVRYAQQLAAFLAASEKYQQQKTEWKMFVAQVGTAPLRFFETSQEARDYCDRQLIAKLLIKGNFCG